MKRVNTWIHLAINALSTVLLASTNYCMQCLNTPTRSQVDAAHSSRRWVNVGTMRLSNLRWVRARKSFLWAVLAMNSVPLHLLWNSAVFSSTTGNAYDIYATQRI